MTTFWIALVAMVFALIGEPANAKALQFDNSWTEQRFSLFSSNDFDTNGDRLSIRSNGTVSLLWARVSEDDWQARQASWKWQVTRGVPATDLTLKGGDDRNLALYFVFLPESVAVSAKDESIKGLLEHPQARVLMYVWGGNHPINAILPTPYLGARGRTIIKQLPATGSASETVDLAADHLAAFDEPAQSLVGIAVSADSDDTDTRIEAEISELWLMK